MKRASVLGELSLWEDCGHMKPGKQKTQKGSSSLRMTRRGTIKTTTTVINQEGPWRDGPPVMGSSIGSNRLHIEQQTPSEQDTTLWRQQAKDVSIATYKNSPKWRAHHHIKGLTTYNGTIGIYTNHHHMKSTSPHDGSKLLRLGEKARTSTEEKEEVNYKTRRLMSRWRLLLIDTRLQPLSPTLLRLPLLPLSVVQRKHPVETQP